MAYAENTTVSSEKSRAEIERTLSRYGASSFMYGWNQTYAQIAFDMNGRRIHFKLAMPDKSGSEITQTPTGKPRSAGAAEQAYEQAVRQRWRALSLVIKAKLEAVEAGITEFEEEFLAHIVLPNGGTVGQFMLPQVEQSYATGQMPPLLPGPHY
ncbi:hypothetical protein V3O24_04455 [Methylobacter sp. Wu8]|uniref:hypothetical protein n=1 Tax=Methylobacter sp. Wu8 TaxID=3118457 RepID=UPI002F2C1CEC